MVIVGLIIQLRKAIDLVSFLRGKGECLEQSIWVVPHELFMVQIELFDLLSAMSCEDLHGDYLLSCKVVLTEFGLWVEDTSDDLAWSHGKDHNLCLL